MVGLKLAITAALTGMSPASPAHAGAPPSHEWPRRLSTDGFTNFLEHHIEVGFQISGFRLKEPKRREFNVDGQFTGGFLGSIDRLNEQQRLVPTPFLRLKFHEYGGIHVGYTAVRARTTTYWDGHSDGTFDLGGPTFELFVRYKLPNDFAPYAAIGIALLSANFKHDELWHNGFSPANPQAYRDWVGAGRPAWPNGGYKRTIRVGNTTAWMLSGGCAYYLTEHWVVDLGIQYTAAEVEANYYLSWYDTIRRDQGDFTIPMDNWSLLLRMGYDF